MTTSQVRQNGVTLIELMVTLAVLAILLAIAAPSFESTIASNRLATTTNNLIGTLSQARMEAIRRGARVTVCISADGASCAAGGGWNQGWISFTDTTRAGATASLDNGETLVGSGSAVPAGISLAGSANVAQYVSFGADGRSWTMGGAAQTGTIRVCSQSTALGNDNRTRDLILIASGLINRETTTGVANSCPAP